MKANEEDNHFKSNDVEYFEKIFKMYRKRYVLFAKSYIRNDTYAEDIVMDVFMNFWEKRDTIPAEKDLFNSYMLTSLKNKALNYLEHQEATLRAYQSFEAHEMRELNFRISTLKACDPEAIFSEEVQKIIQQTFDSLSKQSVLVFNMSRFEDKSNKEIAESLNISVKAVEYHITKTLKIFRENLKDYLFVWILFV